MITVYFDGLCYPRNPGGVAAYGYLVYRDGALIHRGFGAVGEGRGMTNNVAEYEGLRAAIRYIIDEGLDDRILVRGDSQLVINQVKGAWGLKSETSRRYAPEIREMLKGRDVVLEWVPREKNEEADELSRVGYERFVKSKRRA